MEEEEKRGEIRGRGDSARTWGNRKQWSLLCPSCLWPVFSPVPLNHIRTQLASPHQLPLLSGLLHSPLQVLSMITTSGTSFRVLSLNPVPSAERSALWSPASAAPSVILMLAVSKLQAAQLHPIHGCSLPSS